MVPLCFRSQPSRQNRVRLTLSRTRHVGSRKRQTSVEDAAFLTRRVESHKAKMQLLLHKKLHYNFRRIGNGSAGAEDGSDAGFVQEVIILCGDDTTCCDHDVGSAEFLEFLRRKRLATTALPRNA